MVHVILTIKAGADGKKALVIHTPPGTAGTEQEVELLKEFLTVWTPFAEKHCGPAKVRKAEFVNPSAN